MSYSLSFSPDFFWTEVNDDMVPQSSKHPTTVIQALANLSDQAWSQLAREVFHCEPKFLDIEAVLKMVIETNLCLNLNSPVEVAIDPNADFTVLVHDRECS